jgi:riboflavin kinase/FMN adenylyltransferase
LTDSLRGGAVAIGNFDGVHLGHARIIERLVAMAGRVGGSAVVFTFDPHPVRLLRPELAPPPLTWTDRKAELVSALGVDAMIAYPTDMQLLQLSPRDFFDRIVREQLDAKAVVEGPNFFFGHDRAGTIDVLLGLADEAGIAIEVVPQLEIDGEIVSSSRVRRLLANGQVDAARRMLTQPYRLRGMVTHGASRGASIGFPTANLEAIDTLLPAEGVYAGRGYEGDRSWPAAINIGANPTFGEEIKKVEIHLIGCDEPMYGRPLEVDFLRRLRDIRPFDTVDALQAQLACDVEAARDIAN